jgi:hypothetical protein
MSKFYFLFAMACCGGALIAAHFMPTHCVTLNMAMGSNVASSTTCLSDAQIADAAAWFKSVTANFAKSN